MIPDLSKNKTPDYDKLVITTLEVYPIAWAALAQHIPVAK